jgi:hypothetical protein
MNLYIIPDSKGKFNYGVYIEEYKAFVCCFDENNFTKTLYSVQDEIVAIGFFDFTKKTLVLRLNTFVIELKSEETKVNIHFKPFPITKYQFSYKNDNYQAILHFGRKISIFRNGKQIGYYVTDTNLFESDVRGMKLVLDDDSPIPLMILFCMNIYSDFRGEDADGGNPAFNFVLPLKRFDNNWRPNVN